MYGNLVNAVDVHNLEIEQWEALAQKKWRFRHLESLERRAARAALIRVVAFFRNAWPVKEGDANPVCERLSY